MLFKAKLDPCVFVSFQSRWLSCEDEVSLNYTLTVYNKDHHLLREERVDLQNCDSPFRLTLSGLQRDRAYNAYLTVKSDDNSYSFKSKEVYFSKLGQHSDKTMTLYKVL